MMDSICRNARRLRTQLEMQSTVTGQLMGSLDFYPGKPASMLGADQRYTEILTIRRPLEELAKRVEKVPIEGILDKLNAATFQRQSKNSAGQTCPGNECLRVDIPEPFRPKIGRILGSARPRPLMISSGYFSALESIFYSSMTYQLCLQSFWIELYDRYVAIRNHEFSLS
jgi:hypothetical protein